jgi:hypothetical protein
MKSIDTEGKWCKCTSMCTTCRRIVEILERKPLSLSKLAKELRLLPSTLSYHTSGLKRAKILEQVNGILEVIKQEHVDRLVLQVVSGEPKLTTQIESHETLKHFSQQKIEETLQRLLLRRLLTKTVVSVNSAGKTLFKEAYQLSYIGAAELGVCLRCGKPFKDDPFIAQLHIPETIESLDGSAPLLAEERFHRGALLHTSCLKEELDEELREWGTIRVDKACDLCGLPIDAASLILMIRPASIPLSEVLPHLSGNELKGLLAFVMKGKESEGIPSLITEEGMIIHFLKGKMEFVGSLRDCESLLRMSYDGLKLLSHEDYDERYLESRAHSIWGSVSEILRARQSDARHLVLTLCGPAATMLGEFGLRLRTYDYEKFEEEYEYKSGDKEQLGVMKGTVTESSLGLLIQHEGSSYHVGCFERLQAIMELKRQMGSASSGGV